MSQEGNLKLELEKMSGSFSDDRILIMNLDSKSEKRSERKEKTKLCVYGIEGTVSATWGHNIIIERPSFEHSIYCTCPELTPPLIRVRTYRSRLDAAKVGTLSLLVSSVIRIGTMHVGNDSGT